MSVYSSYFRLPLCIASGLWLGGCSLIPSVGPDYTAPAFELPVRWQQGGALSGNPGQPAESATLARWWQQLGDPLLEQLIDEALQGSLDLKLAQAKLQQARASRGQTEAGFFPALKASGGSSRNESAAVISSAPTRTLYDAGFDASWEIDLFGGTRRAVEAASADLESSAASLANTRVSLLAEVATNYIDWRNAQQRQEIARRNLASQEETLQITRWRNQAGLASSSDVEQAHTSVEQTRASLPDLAVALVQAENRIAVLLGKRPGEIHARLAPFKALPEVPVQIAAGIPADVLGQRPDLRMAERTLAAETARIGQQQAKRFPSLSLGGSFGWQAYSAAALGGTGTLTRAVSGTLAATLFDGGKLRQAAAVQTAVQQQALVNYESKVLTALEEVENALASHAAARERVIARRAAAEAAQNAALLTRKQYEAGLADFQKVLETERTRLSAEDNLATARATVLSTLIKLYKALGGGWEDTLPAAANPA
jgi:NodT family efflux transporter outer membrane factor (OMF) lipoprotein